MIVFFYIQNIQQIKKTPIQNLNYKFNCLYINLYIKIKTMRSIQK